MRNFFTCLTALIAALALSMAAYADSYVGPDGKMATNTVINGWAVNAAGECWY